MICGSTYLYVARTGSLNNQRGRCTRPSIVSAPTPVLFTEQYAARMHLVSTALGASPAEPPTRHPANRQGRS